MVTTPNGPRDFSGDRDENKFERNWSVRDFKVY